MQFCQPVTCTIRVKITAIDVVAARARCTRATKYEKLLVVFSVGNGGCPAGFGTPAALSDSRPYTLLKVKEEDVIEA